MSSAGRGVARPVHESGKSETGGGGVENAASGGE